jgi:hypothetical protein
MPESSVLDPQEVDRRQVEKPLVFISAVEEDKKWRDRLQEKFDKLADQIEWWDASKIKRVSSRNSQERQIERAIERADVAVALFSSAYVATLPSTEAVHLDSEQSRGLKVVPILLDAGPLKLPFGLQFELWNHGQPIGNLSDEDADVEAERIAKVVLELARSVPEPRSRRKAQGETSDTRRKTEAAEPEFRFSTTAKSVLIRAWELAHQSGRISVTSSSILFAIADPSVESNTSRFLRILLNRNGEYQAAFDRFLKDGKASGSSVAEPSLSFSFTVNGIRLLRQAKEIAQRLDPDSGETHARHLLAALLVTPDIDSPLAARKRLESLGWDLAAVRLEFRSYLSVYANQDNLAEWDAILGITQGQVEVIDEQRIQKLAGQTGSDSSAAPYQITYPGFFPDRTAYGPLDKNASLDDSLGVGVYAGHLAQLIAAKDTFMPLSIGLFGAWGAGKSHFIDLLDEELRRLTENPRQAFHKQIVQIRFNAWHYLDTNLWANLVSEIFEQLFARLDQREDTTSEQIENLKKKLADQSALAAEAKGALTTAENARREAEDDLRKAVQERTKKEDSLRGLLDDLKTLAISEDARKQLKAAAEGLGLPELESSFEELEARAEEVRSLGGRTKALVLAIFTGPGRWTRALLLVVALAVPLGVAALAAYGLPWMKAILSGAGQPIAQVLAAIAALSAWLASQAKAGNDVVSNLEGAYEKVKQVRAKREMKDDAVRAREALSVKKQVEESARHRLHEAEAKMKAISAELAEMAPGRQLIRFLKQRASAEDYRQHLGLVSLVRRDFEQLSNLMIQTPNAEGPLRGTQDAKESELPKVDRIVLYIDDLDRCRADRVIEVLEAVHLLLAFPLFAVVVAVDPRWLRQSLLDHYPRLLGGADGDSASPHKQRLGRPATPQDYLEKIFQVPFQLQAMEKSGFEALVSCLFPVGDPGSKDQQTWPLNPLTLRGDLITNVPPSDVLAEGAADGPADDATHQAWSGGTVETVLEEEKQTPPDPQRLKLTKKEADDVLRLQCLFQTPRALKRLANTYSLIRVGVGKDEWDDYLSGSNLVGYRVPLLLLAVTSAFPGLGHSWLLWLKEETPRGWGLDEENVTSIAERFKDTTDRSDWERLASSLARIDLDDWPKPQATSLTKWVPRVARYSF